MDKYQEALETLIEEIKSYGNLSFYSSSETILLQKLVDQTKQPTLEEVKQKWEELGYELIRHERRELIFKHKEDGAIFTMWNFNSISYSKYWRGKPAIITFQEHQLLTKTFRALGWENA